MQAQMLRLRLTKESVGLGPVCVSPNHYTRFLLSPSDCSESCPIPTSRLPHDSNGVAESPRKKVPTAGEVHFVLNNLS